MGKKQNFKVDFIGIGADRSGTTWLANCLTEHPEICFSREKELYFFNDLVRHFLKITNPRYLRGMKWYKSFFDHCSATSIKGEFTPTYMYCRVAAERINLNFPDVKLIAILRNPVERAFSQYLHNVRGGVIREMSFEQALNEVDSYVEKGLYFKHLSKFYSIFPKENIKIVVMDDIKSDPVKVIKSVYEFLNLKNTEFLPASVNKKVNIAMAAKWQWLNYAMTNVELFLKKHNGGDIILSYLERSGIRKLAFDIAHFINVRDLDEYPKLSKGTTKKLRKFFRPDIIKLEKLVKKDLRSWL